jgi:hypothetical protein
VALTKINKAKQGQSDIDAAEKLDKTVEQKMQHFGVMP